MKLEMSTEVNWEGKKAAADVLEATRLAMRDTVVAIHGSALDNAIAKGIWLTGNNNRRLTGEVSGMGMVASGGEGEPLRMVDDGALEGAVFSTSGYGGYLEVGTTRGLGPRPYIYPAMTKHFTSDRMAELIRRHLK